MQQFINNLGGPTVLVGAINSTQTTGIVVLAAPSPAVIISGTVQACIPSTGEIFTFTGLTGSGPYTLTGVVRGQEGTAAAAANNGAAIALGDLTAGALTSGLMLAPLRTILSGLNGNNISVPSGATTYSTLATFASILRDTAGGYSYDNPYYITCPAGATYFSLVWKFDLALAGSITGNNFGGHVWYEGTGPTDPGTSTNEAYYHVHHAPVAGGGFITIVSGTFLPVPVSAVYSAAFVDTSGGNGTGNLTLTVPGKSGSQSFAYSPTVATVQGNLSGAATMLCGMTGSGDPTNAADTRIWNPPINEGFGGYFVQPSGLPVITLNAGCSGFTLNGQSSGSVALPKVGLRLTMPIWNNTGITQTINRGENLYANALFEMGSL